MKDTEFLELRLKATIVPQQARWPNDVLRWQKLHEVVDEALQLPKQLPLPRSESNEVLPSTNL